MFDNYVIPVIFSSMVCVKHTKEDVIEVKANLNVNITNRKQLESCLEFLSDELSPQTRVSVLSDLNEITGSYNTESKSMKYQFQQQFKDGLPDLPSIKDYINDLIDSLC